MSTAVAFLELKRVLTSIESTSQKLKANITDGDGKWNKTFVGVEGDDFVGSLEKKVLAVQCGLDIIEINVCGIVETRLSQVTMLEILQKCKTLQVANEGMILAIESQMATYGYKAATPPTNSTILSFERITVDDLKKVVIETRLESVEFDSVVQQIDNEDDEGKVDDKVSIEQTPKEKHITAENNSYNSPPPSKTPTAKGSEHEVKTPALPDWKLSEATRMLVLNKDGKEALPKTRQPSFLSPPRNYHGRQVEDDSPQTPGVMDQTCASAPQARHSSHANQFSAAAYTESESDIFSPQPVTGTVYKKLATLTGGDSPITPNFGTPFHTTHLRNAVTSTAYAPSPGSPEQVNVVRTLVLSPENYAVEATPPTPVAHTIAYSAADSPPMTTPCMQRERRLSGQAPDPSSPDCDIRPLSFQLSPPKMALLAPRPAGSLPEMKPSTIPPVTAEEWESAPAFLRKQTSTEDLNEAVNCINRFIAEKEQTVDGDKDKQGPITLSLGNMENTVPAKATVLGLVHLKRLDIGSVDGVKVYKVKRS